MRPVVLTMGAVMQQIHSGGLLRATPHHVRTPSVPAAGVSRNTFAVFMQPRCVPGSPWLGSSSAGQQRHGCCVHMLSVHAVGLLLICCFYHRPACRQRLRVTLSLRLYAPGHDQVGRADGSTTWQ